MHSRLEIFGTKNVQWLREINLGNGGPSDLVFEFDNKKIVIEFKASHNLTSAACHQDIKKLSILEGDSVIRIFCALFDTFTKNLPDDGRQKNVTEIKNINVKCIFNKDFPTKQNKFNNEISCVVVVWLVG